MPANERPVTDPAKPGNTPRPSEFKWARQRTRHSQAEIAAALGVSRATVSRYESGEREPSQEILDWLYKNRNTSPVFELIPFGNDPETGRPYPRGFQQRQKRALDLYKVTEAVAKAAERAA